MTFSEDFEHSDFLVVIEKDEWKQVRHEKTQEWHKMEPKTISESLNDIVERTAEHISPGSTKK